jgi:hypothetical protein
VHRRLRSSRSRSAAGLALLSVLIVAGCGSKKSDTTNSLAATTLAPSVVTAVATAAPTTVLVTTAAPTTTLPPVTTALAPTTTLPHGAGPILTTGDGTTIDPTVGATANAIYAAAITRDYARIKTIIGDRRFRWGFVGQRRPAEEWQKEFDEGGPDALARMIALLDLPPYVDKRGNTVWPYLAGKDPKEWNDADLVTLASLGFRPEDVEATRIKGIYKDYRLIIGPDGVWTAFGFGY